MSLDTQRRGPSRRSLVGGAGAGILLLGFRLPQARSASAEFAPNGFVRIAGDGQVTLVMPQVEMGQGVYTSVAMILAEELDADFARVAVVHAPPDQKLYGNPVLFVQATGNSNSIRAFWKPLREAGATARAMLVSAAARRWQVDPTTCATEAGEVFHAASGRRLGYGALAADASAEPPPAAAPLKDPGAFTLLGKALKRLDTPDKVNGRTTYGIDALPKGVRFATLSLCPVFGGKVAHVDEAPARAVAGVRQVVVLDDLVAVVGDNTWAARQGLEALDIAWAEGPNAAVDSAAIWADLRQASLQTGVVAKEAGDAPNALSSGKRLEAAYEMPLLAHAPMEPLNCTVHVRPDACDVWIGTQVIGRVQSAVAETLGIPVERVTVHQHMIGGGFGRRLETDMAATAARIGRHVDGPVKVTWTREQDIQHDVYRPVYRDLMAASLQDGRISGWTHRIVGSAVIARWLPPAYQNGVDIDAVDSAIDIPYDLPNKRVEFVRREPPAVPTGFWRGVGPNNNVFAIESFIDELATLQGADPVDFRVAMLDGTPRLREAVRTAAKEAGWGEPLPARVGRGVAAQVAFGSFIATVVEAEVDPGGTVGLRRVVCAVDTGIAVNPDTIVAQLQGGLVFGLTAALYGEVTIDKGRVQQSNFHDYRVLRMNEVPPIEVHLIRNGEAPGGIGEAGTTAAAPALCNALHAATGVRLRRLPIDEAALAARKRA